MGSDSADSESDVEVTCLLAGDARGTALKLTEPLNAWGGLDPESGVIVHHSHPQRGESVTGRVLVMPESRGSGTNAQIFAQAWASGHGPVAVVLGSPDYVLCVGAVVSRELYAVGCPVVVADPGDYAGIHTGDSIVLRASETHSTMRISRRG
jgi:predicted aconitase with swiveling domain